MEKLGSGGFGDTFLAEDTQMPSLRHCVIKQLKPINNNPEIYELVKQRFQREAAILEKLGENNSQIPTLYAYFEEDEQFYLVQELIEGKTLKQLIKEEGILTESQIQNLLLNLLPVLEYVHSEGIVHRDIKPDNIIIRKKDNKPVLIDFGAVREIMGTTVTTGGSTTSSIIIGTPGFMPSEQASGRPVYSSDLYSLGLTIIYLLTAKMPQFLPTNLDTSEVLWHDYILENVSPSLMNIIDKAIKYNPSDRYHNTQEMLRAIQSPGTTINSSNINVVTDQQTTINLLTDLQKKLPFPSNSKLYLMGGFAALITIILGILIGNYWQKRSTLLSQLVPSYVSAIFSPDKAFEPCRGNIQLLLSGETKNYKFQVCGENKKPKYYQGLNKNGHGGVQVKWSDENDGFLNSGYLYQPPSYEHTNINNPTLRVYQGTELILDEPVILLYKLE